MKARFTLAIGLLAILAALPASAAQQIRTELKAEKDIVVTEKGKKVTRRVTAEKMLPGEVIIYTIEYRNDATTAEPNVNLSGLIPDGTAYVVDSARGEGELMFSIDGGKTYKKPTLLTYEVVGKDGKRETLVAAPEKYTHIKWYFPAIPAGGKGSVSYQVRVK